MANAKGKPRKAKLKVFRTPVGFHDAYVAASSRKAALAAWGAGTDLFAAGAAELVTDPKLTREPLERPGEVVRVLRGSAAEQVAALGAGRKKDNRPSPRPSPAGGRGRRPSSAGVERAERALAAADARHREALAQLRAEERALATKRRELERKARAERERLSEAVEDERARFRSAMEEWAR